MASSESSGRPQDPVVKYGQRPWETFLVVLVICGYAVGALYPFKWAPPHRAPNHAEWLPAGGIRFAGPGIARSDGAPPWIEDAMRSQRLKIDLRVRTASTKQGGPARLITLSADPWHRNFTLAQEGEDLILRLRTPQTDENGRPDIRVPDVFQEDTWADLRVAVASGELQIRVDGEVRVRDSLPQDPFRGWDPLYRLALGNELTNDRPWRGDIRRAAVHTAGTTIDYAAHGALTIPAHLWHVSPSPRLIPFGAVELGDAALNLLGFVPLGLLLGWLTRRRQAGHWRGLILIAAVSACLEALQILFAYRYPSSTDFVLNTAGGALGLLFARGPMPADFRQSSV